MSDLNKAKSKQHYYPSGSQHLNRVAPPTRKLTKADNALLKTHTWSNISDYSLEDHVVVADVRQGALQGLVAYVGQVHFGKGIWVGIQLTGPSLGKGYNDGAHQGQRYFQSVGKRNGVFAHVSCIQHRRNDNDTAQSSTPEAQFAQMKCIETLKADRERRILQQKATEKKKSDLAIYIKRIKQQSQEDLRMSRSEPLEGDLLAIPGPKPKYTMKESAIFCEADFLFIRGLQDAKLSFVLTDPTLPDNPITFASHAFLCMTQYTLNHVLGRNCRFLQGKATSKRSIAKIRLAIDEGSDCSLRIVNYKRDGTPFWNEFFCTALRDTKGRIKSHVGVLLEISEQVNVMKNEVAAKLDSRVPPKKTAGSKEAMHLTMKPPSGTRGSSKRTPTQEQQVTTSHDHSEYQRYHYPTEQHAVQERYRGMIQHCDTHSTYVEPCAGYASNTVHHRPSMHQQQSRDYHYKSQPNQNSRREAVSYSNRDFGISQHSESTTETSNCYTLSDSSGDGGCFHF